MKDLLGADWNRYKALMDDAHATFNQKTIIWQHRVVSLNRYQEDLPTPEVETLLLVLINYNYRRAWPVNLTGDAGEEDQQSLQVYINKNYLSGLTDMNGNSWIDTNGNFTYDQDFDRFIIDGVLYKSLGDTSAGQASNTDLFFTIVLKRIQNKTGSAK